MNLEDIEKTSKELIDFERSMALLFTEGKIKGASHFSRGNEEQLIKIFRGLREGDYIFHLFFY